MGLVPDLICLQKCSIMSSWALGQYQFLELCCIYSTSSVQTGTNMVKQKHYHISIEKFEPEPRLEIRPPDL